MAKLALAFDILARDKGASDTLRKVGDAADYTGGKASKFGDAVKRSMKVAVVAAGAAAATVAGLALKGGFDRALNIEDAQASLRGLGHDTKAIETIMDSALASVKGTAFGLGDAATIAATAVAAGIKPGEHLTRTLKLTANTAALARTGLDEMGSILNKVWTQGKVGTEELNQLADRGIPIWTKLAEHYGVSGEELRKMVSQGKVDATAFAEVLEGTVGTAADEMGKTTRGMAQNVMAALSRVGEGFVSQLLPTIKDAMGGTMEALDGIAPAVEKMGQTFGTWIVETAVPAVKSLAGWLKDTLWPAIRDVWDLLSGAFSTAVATVSDALRDSGASAGEMARSIGSFLVGALETLGPILAGVVKSAGDLVGWMIRNRDILIPLAAAVGAAVAAWKAYVFVQGVLIPGIKAARAAILLMNASLLANPVGLVVAAIAALVVGLVVAYKQSETFRNIVDAAWNGIKTAVSAAWENVIKPAFEAIRSFVVDTLMPIILNLWQNVIKPAFEGIGAVISFAWNNVIQPLFKLWWAYITNVLVPIVKTLWSIIQTAFNAIAAIISFVWNNVIYPVLQLWWAYITNILIPVLKALWDNVIKPVFEKIAAIVKWAWDKVIYPILSAWWAYITETLIPVLKALWENTVKPVFESIRDAIVTAWNDHIKPAFEKFRDIVDAVRENFETGKDRVDAFIKAIKDFKLPDWVQKLVDAAKTIGGGFGNAAKNVGKVFGIGDAPAEFRGVRIGGGAGGGGNALARVRAAMPDGLRVTSTYRSPAGNRAVGGHPRSLHMDRNNPAVDIAGPVHLMDRFAGQLRAMGGWRQLLWRVAGHYDHIHVAHAGGQVSPLWPRMPGDRWDERTARLQVGEVVVPKARAGQVGESSKRYELHAHNYGRQQLTPADLLQVARSMDLLDPAW